MARPGSLVRDGQTDSKVRVGARCGRSVDLVYVSTKWKYLVGDLIRSSHIYIHDDHLVCM